MEGFNFEENGEQFCSVVLTIISVTLVFLKVRLGRVVKNARWSYFGASLPFSEHHPVSNVGRWAEEDEKKSLVVSSGAISCTKYVNISHVWISYNVLRFGLPV